MSEDTDDIIIENPINDSQFYRGDKNVPKEDAQFEWTPKMVKELKKCKENITHFAEDHFYIVNLDLGKIKIELYKAQKRALKSLADNRFVCVLASRQCGKTTISTIYALWNTCFFDDQRVIIVANKIDVTPYESLSNEIRNKIEQVALNAKAELIPMSNISDENVGKLKVTACDKLLEARVDSKLSTMKKKFLIR